MKSDVYSFGMILFEMITNTLPFPELSPVQIIYAVAIGKQQPSIPDHLQSNSELIKLMKCCWCYNAEERPTFLEIVGTLERILKS